MILIGGPPGVKLTVASNISSLMKELSERSIFIFWVFDVSVPFNKLETGY